MRPIARLVAEMGRTAHLARGFSYLSTFLFLFLLSCSDGQHFLLSFGFPLVLPFVSRSLPWQFPASCRSAKAT